MKCDLQIIRVTGQKSNKFITFNCVITKSSGNGNKQNIKKEWPGMPLFVAAVRPVNLVELEPE